MPSEVIRCSDCGTAFKGIPSWLATAKVNFTCTSCPKRPTRAGVRFEPSPVVPVAVVADPDSDVAVIDIDEADEDADLEIADDLDEVKDEDADKDL